MPTTPVSIVWAFLVGTVAILGLTGTVIVISIRNQRKQLEAEREKERLLKKALQSMRIFLIMFPILFLFTI